MKYLMWLLNAAIFFVLFAFALNNHDSVTLHFFFGHSWQAPLVLVLLLVLLIGVGLGVLVMLPLWLRARRPRSRSGAGTTTFGPESTVMPHEPIDRRHGL
ncbi:MAG: DUF1049 domain-containing protein [Hydrogenophaga sp.]|uniref:lipopolysaccharide assembly protein LapA domain-containing protein n=1 Tax=Hydrogenophaga sp. TaxID=1904254 RepID=UPI001DCCE701|nr:lipopolysaccharide assembly protein LapA domain-containing protein [Hydrogenophaga sp.]MBX3610896.1 DUF1049 domain-containing protein [Hydrogenophaga sp.]